MITSNGSRIKCLISNIIVCIISIVCTYIILKCGHSTDIDTSHIDSLQVIIDSLSNRKDSIDLQIDTVTVQLEKVKVTAAIKDKITLIILLIKSPRSHFSINKQYCK